MYIIYTILKVAYPQCSSCPRQILYSDQSKDFKFPCHFILRSIHLTTGPFMWALNWTISSLSLIASRFRLFSFAFTVSSFQHYAIFRYQSTLKTFTYVFYSFHLLCFSSYNFLHLILHSTKIYNPTKEYKSFGYGIL